MDRTEELRKLREIFNRPGDITDDDIEVLRVNSKDIPQITGSQATAVMARLEVELIAAIRRLDKTSIHLINTTNKLTGWILALTIVGVALTAAGVFLGVVQIWFRR